MSEYSYYCDLGWKASKVVKKIDGVWALCTIEPHDIEAHYPNIGPAVICCLCGNTITPEDKSGVLTYSCRCGLPVDTPSPSEEYSGPLNYTATGCTDKDLENMGFKVKYDANGCRYFESKTKPMDIGNMKFKVYQPRP